MVGSPPVGHGFLAWCFPQGCRQAGAGGRGSAGCRQGQAACSGTLGKPSPWDPAWFQACSRLLLPPSTEPSLAAGINGPWRSQGGCIPGALRLCSPRGPPKSPCAACRSARPCRSPRRVEGEQPGTLGGWGQRSPVSGRPASRRARLLLPGALIVFIGSVRGRGADVPHGGTALAWRGRGGGSRAPHFSSWGSRDPCPPWLPTVGALVSRRDGGNPFPGSRMCAGCPCGPLPLRACSLASPVICSSVMRLMSLSGPVCSGAAALISAAPLGNDLGPALPPWRGWQQ